MKIALSLAATLAVALSSAPAWASPSNVDEPASPTFQLAGTPIPHSFTSYSFNFVASSALTNLTFAFRDDPAFLTLDNVSVTTGGGANMLVNGGFELGPVGNAAPTGWTYLNQYGATAGGMVQSGVGVNGSNGYYDGAVQAYDAITQALATVSGRTYNVSFMLSENSNQANFSELSTNGNVSNSGGNGINLAVYAQNGIPAAAGAVPEAATWAMMIAGFGMIGFAMRRRQKVSVSYAA